MFSFDNGAALLANNMPFAIGTRGTVGGWPAWVVNSALGEISDANPNGWHMRDFFGNCYAFGADIALSPELCGYTGADIGPDDAAVQLFAKLFSNFKTSRPAMLGQVYRVAAPVVLRPQANKVLFGYGGFAMTLAQPAGNTMGNFSRVLTIADGRKFQMIGTLAVFCYNSTDDTIAVAYADRTADVGLEIRNCRHSLLDRVFVRGARYTGVLVFDGRNDGVINSFLQVQQMDLEYCGLEPGVRRALVTATSRSGASGSTNQRETLTLTTVPAELAVGSHVYVPDATHPSGRALRSVMAIDRVARTVTVFPWLGTALPAGTEISFMQGGSAIVMGNDNNAHSFGQIRSGHCAHGPQFAGAYVANVDVCYAFNTWTAGVLGTVRAAIDNANPTDPQTSQINRPVAGVTYHRLTAEYNADAYFTGGDPYANIGAVFGLIQQTIAGRACEATTYAARDPEDFHLPRLTDGATATDRGVLDGFTVYANTDTVYRPSVGRPKNDPAAQTAVLTPANVVDGTFRVTSRAPTLVIGVDTRSNAIGGLEGFNISWMHSGIMAGDRLTLKLDVAAVADGWKLDFQHGKFTGTQIDIGSGLAVAPLSVQYEWAAKRVIVGITSRTATGRFTQDMPSMTAGVQQLTTIPCVGLRPGDTITRVRRVLTATGAAAPLTVLSATCTTADELRLLLRNSTGATINELPVTGYIDWTVTV